MITITDEARPHAAAIEALLDRGFGTDRRRKRSYAFRRGVPRAEGLCLVALVDGKLAGSIRYWPIAIGEERQPPLLLRPLAVDPHPRPRVQNIVSMTRSGGVWPSAKVLMLTMTFSPMSVRPSIVDELICGSSTTLSSRSSLGLIAGSCSKTSSPAPASSPCPSIRVSATSSITSPREAFTI